MLEAGGCLGVSYAQRQTLTPEQRTTEIWGCGSSAAPPTTLCSCVRVSRETPMQPWGHLATYSLPALKQPSPARRDLGVLRAFSSAMIPSCQAASGPEPETHLMQRMTSLSVIAVQASAEDSWREGTGVRGDWLNKHQGLLPFTPFSLNLIFFSHPIKCISGTEI